MRTILLAEKVGLEISAGLCVLSCSEFVLVSCLHVCMIVYLYIYKLHGLSPRANYTDRATAACRRSDCQLVRIESATWSA
jgi:hypothetical protein